MIQYAGSVCYLVSMLGSINQHKTRFFQALFIGSQHDC